jgi:hypothetical protein
MGVSPLSLKKKTLTNCCITKFYLLFCFHHFFNVSLAIEFDIQNVKVLRKMTIGVFEALVKESNTIK